MTTKFYKITSEERKEILRELNLIRRYAERTSRKVNGKLGDEYPSQPYGHALIRFFEGEMIEE